METGTKNTWLSWFFNMPWTIVAFVLALISFPYKISASKKGEPQAYIVRVKSFWWYAWLPSMKGVRAMALGNVILLGNILDERDVAHELIHIEQASRKPFMYPFLYFIETLKKGYRNNKYEIEAYQKAGNVYLNGTESRQ